MKKKIKFIINESQKDLLLKTVQMENVGVKPTKIIVNENQFQKIIQRRDEKITEQCGSIDEMGDLDFCEKMIDTISSLYTDGNDANFENFQQPEWMNVPGMSVGKFKELLVGNGIMVLVNGDEGNYLHKVVKKGLMKNLIKLKSEMCNMAQPEPEPSQEDVIEEDSIDVEKELIDELDYRDMSSDSIGEIEPTVEPIEDDTQEDTSRIVDVIDDSSTYVLVRLDDGLIVYFEKPSGVDSNSENYLNSLVEKLQSLTITDNTQTFIEDYDTAMVVTKDNVDSVIEAFKSLDYDETDKEIQVLVNLNTISEATTTGSVGGQYETPFAWSKNPLKGRFSQKPTHKGGKFIKGGLEDRKN